MKRLLAILLLSATAHAADVTCDGTYADCNAKIQAAAEGDSVTIGSSPTTAVFDWTSNTVNVSKNITIKGYGSGRPTTDTTNVTTVKGSRNIFIVKSTSSDFPFIIKDIVLEHVGTDGNQGNRAWRDSAPAHFGRRIGVARWCLHYERSVYR